MSYGYIEVGVCYRCSSPDHLFVSSEVGQDGLPICAYCWNHWFNSSSWPTEQEFPILATGLKCDGCLRPEIEGHERFGLVIAYLADGRAVTAHIRCTNRESCVDCNITYANAYNRPWRSTLERSRDAYHNGDFAEFTQIDGASRCTACAENYYEENGGESNFQFCEQCEDTVRLSETGRFEGIRYCRTCLDNNVYTCDDCGDEYWDGNHDSCSADEEDESVIHSYSYRPRPYFIGTGQYHLGFELEVEARNGSRYEGAEIAQNTLGATAYMKDDGSLSDGFEIVTHPHTLEKYQKEFKWEVLAKLKAEGYRSWNTTSCGLHVHVSRTAFGTGSDPWSLRITAGSREKIILARQSHELRFMKLVYDNQRQVERIAGRSNNNYAAFNDKGHLVRKVKYGEQNNGRYSAINTENDATIEVRVFKGSLRKERVLSALEFVTAAVEYTRDLKVTPKNQALTWLAFTGYVSSNLETYPNLAIIMSESFASDVTNPNEN
jgi:hypothetical protein